jgi:hypothetical protein
VLFQCFMRCRSVSAIPSFRRCASFALSYHADSVGPSVGLSAGPSTDSSIDAKNTWKASFTPGPLACATYSSSSASAWGLATSQRRSSGASCAICHRISSSAVSHASNGVRASGGRGGSRRRAVRIVRATPAARAASPFAALRVAAVCVPASVSVPVPAPIRLRWPGFPGRGASAAASGLPRSDFSRRRVRFSACAGLVVLDAANGIIAGIVPPRLVRVVELHGIKGIKGIKSEGLTG